MLELLASPKEKLGFKFCCALNEIETGSEVKVDLRMKLNHILMIMCNVGP